MAIKDFYTENNINQDAYSGMQSEHSVSEGPGFSNATAVVKISDLEQAGDKVNELNRMSNLGAQATVKMDRVIEALKECWRTSDAVTHINNLITIKDCSAALSSTALEVSIAAHREIEKMQQTVEANGGAGVSIGSLTITSFGDSLKSNALMSPTTEAFVDGEAANHQASALKEAREMFFEFTERYKNIKDFMLEIWQSGGARRFIEEQIDNFFLQSQTFAENFDKAIRALDMAIANWNRAGASRPQVND